jgi:aminopeptidase N
MRDRGPRFVGTRSWRRYDVRHYDLTYTPPAPAPAPIVGQLSGVATSDFVATQDLDRFNLDLRDMSVQAITINGKDAREVTPPAPGAEVDGAAYWQVQDDADRVWELTIQPRPKIKNGQTARVVVAYGGETTRPEDIEGALYGWVTTRDGAMVVGEPEGSMTWYPVSDHQTDKATYSFEITVPEGKVAVANGLPARDPITEDGRTTWFWDAPDAQASYLTTASVGDYELRHSETPGGLPIIDAVDDNLTAANAATSDASGDPGPFGLFLAPIYERGAATLRALRGKIGDDAFYAATREWLTRHDDSTGTSEDFQAVCEEASDQDLDAFFDVWVRTPSKPTTW